MSAQVLQGPGDYLERVDRADLLPRIARRVIAAPRSAGSSLDQLEAVLSGEPRLIQCVLGVAGTPLIGVRSHNDTLRRALWRLGSGARGVVAALALRGAGRGGPWGELLWRHSEATGWIARMLARYMRGVGTDELFVAGLLHELGLLLLLGLEPGATGAMLEAHGAESSSLIRAEIERWGFCHGRLSAECLRAWHLPPRAAELIEHHHCSVDQLRGLRGDLRPVAALQIADALATPLLSGAGVQELHRRLVQHPMGIHLHVPRGARIAVLGTLVEHRGELISPGPDPRGGDASGLAPGGSKPCSSADRIQGGAEPSS
ncbi:MAG TPA: HDOD domain-containing protein [Deltaproteobacteria bacterium]|nr:HDOD domain-containing protein [Deltaproteobacteria bacterium]